MNNNTKSNTSQTRSNNSQGIIGSEFGRDNGPRDRYHKNHNTRKDIGVVVCVQFDGDFHVHDTYDSEDKKKPNHKDIG